MRDLLIHVVDDDEAVRLALLLLLRASGWRACAFASAEEYLEVMLRGEGADCLLLDLAMPGMNGMELLEALTIKQPALPVIVVSGQCNPRMATRALKAGARYMLDKPFQPSELTACIERAVGLT